MFTLICDFVDVGEAPNDLAISAIKPSSAEISWIPSDSSLNHMIRVDDGSAYKAMAGTCKYKLTGLTLIFYM